MAQRLVRAKSKIRTAGIPFRVPADAMLPDRLAAALRVIYLIFNEGYAVEPGLVARPARPLQRGDPAREAPVRADARRARGVRPAGADAAAGLPPRRAPLARRRARAARRPGPRPLGRARDRRGPADARPRRGVPRAPGSTSSRRRSPPATPRARTRRPSPRPTRRCCGSTASPVARLNHAAAVALAGDVEEGLRLIDAIDGLGRVPALPLGQGRSAAAARPLRGGARRLPRARSSSPTTGPSGGSSRDAWARLAADAPE